MKTLRKLVLVALIPGAIGCASTGATTFVHPEYDFGFMETIAVIPLENLTQDQGAGARASRYFVSELLATEAFDVVEPGEVAKALAGISLVRSGDLTRDEAMTLGRQLHAQAVLLGSVAESAVVRSGSTTDNVVTLDVRLIETETGTTVWSTTNTRDGRGFWSAVFGTGGRSLGEVTRQCVRACINQLLD